MQPQRERVKLSKDRNWWRVLPVLGALGLIGLMLALTMQSGPVDEPTSQPSAMALLSSPTPSSEPMINPTAVLFPTTIPILVTPEQAAVPNNQQPLIPIASPALVVDALDQPLTENPSQLYALIRSNARLYDQVVRVVDGQLLPIANVDSYSDDITLVLQAEQTLIIQREQQLRVIDTATGTTRWTFGLENANDRASMVALDAAGQGIYLLTNPISIGVDQWQLHHLSLVDGQALEAVIEFEFSAQASFLLTKTGQIWFTLSQTLYRLDLKTDSYENFGPAINDVIVGDSQSASIGVFRSPSDLYLIDHLTGTQRSIRLAEPIDGRIEAATFSHDQQKLLIQSSLETHTESMLLVVSSQTGFIETTIQIPGAISSAMAGATVDQWLITTPIESYQQAQLLRWNSATNVLTDLIIPAELIGFNIIPLYDLAGAPIKSLFAEPPTVVDQAASSTIPITTPIALLGNLAASSLNIQRLDRDQQMSVVAEDVLAVFPRYNNAPRLLQHPEPQRWQLFDPVTQQTVQWEFKIPVKPEAFVPLAHPSFSSLLAVVHQPVSSEKEFTGSSQLLRINGVTGDWQVLFDSENWPELQSAMPIAWQFEAIYFLQTTSTQQIIWRVNLNSIADEPFAGAEKIAEVPIAFYSSNSAPTIAKIIVSPNQHWIVYPLGETGQTMQVMVLDLLNQRSHELGLELNSLESLSFSPYANTFAIMLEDAETDTTYPALYQLVQQRWYRLASGSYNYASQNPFLWSPNGQWLAVNFSNFSNEHRVNVYDGLESQLLFSSEVAPNLRPLALGYDPTSLLMSDYQAEQLVQMTWREQQWQIDWQLADVILERDDIRYLYPR
ncbi:hypothetical protein [Herpetosiphon llansteffanensis]|uniref:hypothetical protein n=1 Tax=Herpetosiphon llansteffanensis TaxID=2094568 RepID=UPI000D7C8536|nr:hypothetical protein [Herpetosiphon llansteffanensis]